MTPKEKTTETLLAAGHEPDAVVEAVVSSDPTKLTKAAHVSLHSMTAAEALDLLKSLRAKGGPVVIDAPEGRPLDSVVVDAHHYAGEWRDRKTWWFHPISLNMACRVAGWKVTTAGKGRLGLS